MYIWFISESRKKSMQIVCGKINTLNLRSRVARGGKTSRMHTTADRTLEIDCTQRSSTRKENVDASRRLRELSLARWENRKFSTTTKTTMSKLWSPAQKTVGSVDRQLQRRENHHQASKTTSLREFSRSRGYKVVLKTFLFRDYLYIVILCALHSALHLQQSKIGNHDKIHQTPKIYILLHLIRHTGLLQPKSVHYVNCEYAHTRTP